MTEKILFRKKWISFLFVICTFPAIAQTEILMTYHDGTEQTFLIAETSRLYFLNANLVIDEGDESPQNIELASIRKITFPWSTMQISEPEQDEQPIIYPNPAQNFICVSNTSSGEMAVKIYSLSGKLILSDSAYVGSEIDISTLPSGLYLVKLNNKTFKLSKL